MTTIPFGVPLARRTYPAGSCTDDWSAPDGWPLRRLTVPPGGSTRRGSLLFLGGRGDHFEKYVEAIDGWARAGWRVDSFDWRGQGGSGRLSPNPLVGHANDFAPWVDDLRAYVAQWKQTSPAPHAIVAHSMGGHLLLRGLAERALSIDAAVLVAPMLGFRAPYPDRIGLMVASLMTRIGDPARAAWKASEKPGAVLKLRQKLLTHDAARYADETWWREQLPQTVLGPASWRWVRSAYASFLTLGRPGVLETVTTPLLVLSTSVDALVDPAAIRRDVARLPSATFHQYGAEAAHELLRESDGVRDDVLARIDIFLQQAAPVS